MSRGITKYAYALCFLGLIMTLHLVVAPFRIYTVDIFLAGLLACVTYQILTNHVALHFRWQTIDTVVLLILAAVTVSTLLSENMYRSVVPWCDWLRICIFWFCSRALGGARVPSNFFAKAMLWLAFLLVFAGMLEKATGNAYMLVGNYFGGSTEQDLSMVNLRSGQQERRISGTTINPNVYSQWVIIFGSIGFMELVRRRKYTYCVALFLSCLLVVLFTASRASIIGIVLSAMIFSWLVREQLGEVLLRILLIIGVAIIAGVWFAEDINPGRSLDVVMERFDREFGGTTIRKSNRVVVAKMGLELLQRDPKNFLFGVGGDNFFPAYMKRARRASLREPRSGVHNVWLKSATEYGVLMTCSLLTFFLLAVAHAYRSSTTSTKRPDNFWGRCLLIVLIPYLLIMSQMYESSLMYHIMIPLFSIIGFSVSVSQRSERYLIPRFAFMPNQASDVLARRKQAF